MKRILPALIALCLFGIGFADAAVRDGAGVSRTATGNITAPQRGIATIASARQTVSRGDAAQSRGIDSSTGRTTTTTTARSAATATHSRAAVTTSRAATNKPRTATSGTVSRAATAARAAIPTTTARTTTTARATTTAIQSKTFGTGYNACRDAYFTCMDQFCANQDDAYRRCVCSSRLTDVKNRERALSQASDQLQDFKDLNIEVIPKTAAEVKAMLTASEGETIAANAKDKSAAAQQLAGISGVLATTKSKSMSTAGTLDIAGDINQIWATTDLAQGVNISNLSGEALYNAVHSQCANLVADSCASEATLNMVVSAYGMYIENDCRALLNALDQKKVQANSTIRATEREMNVARLENYNAHNSTSINDCIAQVRADITAETACGPNYVHCLDVTGRYLNRDTGEPIYTADFYQLEMQISLSNDVLNNQSNRMIVNELNSKRIFAERGLETCRDLADDVWDEFMRQAIAEIYQGQQERVRQVKNECLYVVSNCYDEQANSLKDFSNVKEQLLLGARLELSEEMCAQKLDACSNLYGGGPGGLSELITAMHQITDQKIAKECRATLKDFALDMCAVPSNDSAHKYPYGCRVYAPGEQQYAAIDECNRDLTGEYSSSGSGGTRAGTDDTGKTPSGGGYSCPEAKMYTSCNPGYYMAYKGQPDSTPKAGNTCLKCTSAVNVPECGGQSYKAIMCGEDYVGSLYQKMVRYALQVCVRPGETLWPIPESILADVNMVMDTIRIDMATVLSAECDRLNGYWVDSPWESDDGTEHKYTGHKLHKRFYNETGSNTKWGYCADKSSVMSYYDEDEDDASSSATRAPSISRSAVLQRR